MRTARCVSGALIGAFGKNASHPVGWAHRTHPAEGVAADLADAVDYAEQVGEIGARSISSGQVVQRNGLVIEATESIMGLGGAIELPMGSTRCFDRKAELAVVFGRTAHNVRGEDAMAHFRATRA